MQNSFKSTTEFYMGGIWNLPAKFSLSNYSRVWNSHFLRYLFNSLVVVGGSLGLLLIAGSSAAYGPSRIRFRIRGFLYYLFVGGLTIPVHITLIPVYIVTRSIGLYDSR